MKQVLTSLDELWRGIRDLLKRVSRNEQDIERLKTLGSTASSSGGGTILSNNTPSPLGTPAAGTGASASRYNHVHQMPSAADVGAATSGHGHAFANLTDYDGTPAPTDGQVLTFNNGTSKWEPQDPTGGAALSDATPADLGTAAAGVGTEASRDDHVHNAPAFTELTDTPNSYSGQSLKYPRVNAGETDLELVSGTSGVNVQDIDGTPLVSGATTIEFTNGTVSNPSAGVARVTIATGSGDSTTTDVLASRPAAGNDGNLFLPSDGVTIHRDTGAAWKTWGPLLPLVTPPVSSGFTWVNQGTSFVTDHNEGFYIESQVLSGTSWRILKKAAPSTPYTITAMGIPCWYPTSSQNIALGWRQSSDGKLALLTLAGGNSINSVKYTNETTISANYVAITGVPGIVNLFLRIEDDGTDRKCFVSRDGQHWTLIHSVGRTDFLTGDEIVVAVNGGSTSAPTGLNLIHWVQG